MIKIDSVELIRPPEVSEADTARAGFQSNGHFLAFADGSELVYRVEFHLEGTDSPLSSSRLSQVPMSSTRSKDGCGAWIAAVSEALGRWTHWSRSAGGPVPERPISRQN